MLKRKFIAILLVFIGLSGALSASCDDCTCDNKDNAVLQDRVEKLEKALSELQGKKPPARSKYNMDYYGYLKGDMSKDDSEVSVNGNFCRWVNRENLIADDSHFNVTANESRFGFNLNGPQDGKTNVKGNLEFDLFGGERPDNRSNVALRHAYIRIDWPEDEWALMAGQTWDLLGFGVPSTLNYTACWWAGNIGYRRPQLRLSKSFTYDKEHKLVIEGGAFRTIGNAGPFTLNDTGDDASSPSLQGRIAYTFPGFCKKPTSFAVSGLSGKEEVDSSAIGGDFQVKCSAVAFNLDLPIADKVLLKGEYWTGKNLDTYLGGIGQGVVMTNATGTKAIDGTGLAGTYNITDVQTIKARGRWLNLQLGPFGKWNYGLGYSNDDPKDDILINGARCENTSKWLNAVYNLNEAVTMGLELMRSETDYIGFNEATNNRIQSSVIYRF